MTDQPEQYRVVTSTHFTRPALALAPRHSDVTTAVADMGEGIVVTADGTRVVAFHERHLRFVEHALATGRLSA